MLILRQWDSHTYAHKARVIGLCQTMEYIEVRIYVETHQERCTCPCEGSRSIEIRRGLQDVQFLLPDVLDLSLKRYLPRIQFDHLGNIIIIILSVIHKSPQFFVLQILGKFAARAVFNIMSIACPLCMLIKLSRNLKNVNYIVSFLTLIPLRISFTSLIRESLWAICFTCTHIHTIDTPSDTHSTYTK